MDKFEVTYKHIIKHDYAVRQATKQQLKKTIQYGIYNNIDVKHVQQELDRRN